MNRPARIAVVGSGPAGMYSVQHLLEQHDTAVEIDLYERLPTPWGLVRYGVAPDHPEKKLITERLFHFLLQRPEVQLIGNLQVGRDVSVDELAAWYDAVIYAIGAQGDLDMGIAGEALPGCAAAREFVSWYNGHPDHRQQQWNLSGERAVIIGNGNVALDVARILTLPIETLARTDMAPHALAALSQSRIREVVIVGRRGWQQSAFNSPEFEELLHLHDVEVVIEGDSGLSIGTGEPASWAQKLKNAVLAQLLERRVENPSKRIVLKFLASPIELRGDGKVERIELAINALQADANGSLQAMPTGERQTMETSLVLRAIGYRGKPLEGLPFDARRGVIPNREGQIVDGDSPRVGAYTTGWIKRGPSGIIGTNKKCARQTTDRLLADLRSRPYATSTLERSALLSILHSRKPDLIALNDWSSIDRAEKLAGVAHGRPRVKFTDVQTMLRAAQAA